MKHKDACAIIVSRGSNVLMTPKGDILPMQVSSVVTDVCGENPSAIIELVVNIFPTKEEAMEFYNKKG